MYASAAPRLSLKRSSTLSALVVDERERDTRGVSLPCAEVRLVVRFGPAAERGLDIHALGGRLHVHRKILHGGQRVVSARLDLGAAATVLGVPASEVAGRIVPLEDLWGDLTMRRLVDRLAAARNTFEAGAILEGAIAERVAKADRQGAHTQLALAAANRLTTASVNAVAVDLGVSERHLRRVFRETVGVSPKAFAKVTRFRRAVRAAHEDSRASWASIAVATGYYDQAHLIAEFRAIAGVTPQALLGELRAAQAIA